VRLAVCAVSLAMIPGTASASPRAFPARVTLDGVGGVFPGLRVDQVERRWRISLRYDSAAGSTCRTASVRRGTLDGYALFENGRFGAVFFRRGAATGRGIRIGSSRDELRRAYRGLLRSRPNAYTPGARDYFVRRARSPRWEMRFDVSPRGRVTMLAFGAKQVRYVEGCA
jgi:hypothetical protein